MTNKDKAKELAEESRISTGESCEEECYDCAMLMAEWKDEQVKKTVTGVWLSSIMCQDHTLSNKDHQYIDLDELKNILEDFFHIKI